MVVVFRRFISATQEPLALELDPVLAHVAYRVRPVHDPCDREEGRGRPVLLASAATSSGENESRRVTFWATHRPTGDGRSGMSIGSPGASRRAMFIGGVVLGIVVYLLLNPALTTALLGPGTPDPEMQGAVTQVAAVAGLAVGAIVIAIGAALPTYLR